MHVRARAARVGPVVPVPLPRSALLADALPHRDYEDAFAVRLPQDDRRDVDAFARAFFANVPAWVKWLMLLRNAIVRPLGLKTGGMQRRRAAEAVPYEPGMRAGIFRVLGRTEHELLMGENDRHLDFRVSLLVRQHGGRRWCVCSTVVRFNGWLGRLYFLPVRYFHRLVVPAMLRSAAERSAQG